MALIYATSTDLSTWTSATAPANATQLLRRASGLVRKATATAFYATDPTGLPTDPDTLQAFKDATCAQAAMWTAAGIDPAGGGVAVIAPLKAKRIGSAGLDYDTSASSSVTAYTARGAAAVTLCEEAVDILQAAGINLINPWIAG